MNRAAVIILAFILDFILGDPQNPLHPVRLIGGVIGLGIKLREKLNLNGKAISFVYGTFLTVAIIAAVYFVTRGLLDSVYGLNYWLGFVMEVILCYFAIAVKALKDESMQVYSALENSELQNARHKLSYIVGRDTQNLQAPDIIRAAVETIAENLSDSAIAPLLFMSIGGAPLALAYKAINTLDSMLGYRNEAFEYFGKFAARLDDAANLIPSRISAVLMLAACFLTGMNTKRAFNTFIKDRYKHKSPNSAQTESVCAGALGLSLGGDNFYHGKLVCKPVIGEHAMEPETGHIRQANRLMYTTVILAVIVISVLMLACKADWRDLFVYLPAWR